MARFADSMKRHQLKWALSGEIPKDHLEIRGGQVSWVLKQEYRESNLFDPAWWRFIAGQEHRWARALNSSQCFAVNLFASAAKHPTLAKALLTAATGKTLSERATVKIAFEHTPEGAPKWLGESRQPTQVDVFFTVTESQKTVGHLLVEVKLTEPEFGSCRGPKGLDKNGNGNPHPERCRRGPAVAARHGELCWLASCEGRQYWNIIAQCPGQFDFTCLGDGEPCPFGGGLYQVLRNYALGRALVSRTDAHWAVFVTCVHPENLDAYKLKEAVAGHKNVLAAFHKLAGNKACRDLDPRLVVDISESECRELSAWASYMRARYLLGENSK